MITIDYQSKLPLYEQIAKRFQTLILKGALPPDSQMPSVRSLAMDLPSIRIRYRKHIRFWNRNAIFIR